jgi:hypothetical protein
VETNLSSFIAPLWSLLIVLGTNALIAAAVVDAVRLWLAADARHRSRQLRWVIGLIGLFLAVNVIAFGRWHVLTALGTTVNAEVTSADADTRWTKTRRMNRPVRSYFVRARFQDDRGHPVDLLDEISEEGFQSIRKGSKVPFVVWKARPTLYQIGKRPGVNPVLAVVFGLLAGITLAAYAVNRRGRSRPGGPEAPADPASPTSPGARRPQRKGQRKRRGWKR